jgi:hypothetical protein
MRALRRGVMARPTDATLIFRVVQARKEKKETTTLFDVAQALGRTPESLAAAVAIMVSRGYLHRVGRLSPTEGRRGRTLYTLGAAFPKQLRSSAAQAARSGGGMPLWISPRADALREMVPGGAAFEVRTVRAHATDARGAGPTFTAALRVASCLKEHAVLLHSPALELSGLAAAGAAMVNY